MDRRGFIRSASLAGLGVAAGSLGARAAAPGSKTVHQRYSGRALRVVEQTTVVEMLGGFQDELNTREGRILTDHWLDRPESFTADDFRFVKSSGIDVFALGDLVPDRDGMILYLGRWNGFIASNSHYLERIDTTQKLLRAGSSEKISVLLSFQDSKHFGTVDDVDLFYGLGQRVAQLTYNNSNRLGFGAFDDDDKGLTSYGAELVARMNKLGMAVDLSHCGDRTTLGAIEQSSKPVLVTHAACRALNPGYPRAKTDEAIRKVAATRGVIGIPMLRFMIRDREPVSIEDFLDHIDHVADLVGIEHIGIGSDLGLVTEDQLPVEKRKQRLEGAPAKYKVHTNEDHLIGIENLDHELRTFDVAEGLIRRGYSDEHIALVLGGNFVRALAEIFVD
jgi:membrane dipeptidase